MNILKKMLRILLFGLLTAMQTPGMILAAHIDLPKDSDGWTIFTPSADTDVVYISESGNDGLCRSYRTSDSEMGSDPFRPVGAVQPCATYSKAYSLTGNYEPDWILFKRGEEFVDAIGQNIRHGKNTSEPFLISAYGVSGGSPLIKTGSNHAIVKDNPLYWVAVMGLDFYAHTRDPDSPDFVSYGLSSNGIDFVLDAGEAIEGILFEGCRFGFYSGSRMQQHQGTYLKDITFRRNIFYKNYSTTGHAQGLFTDRAVGIVFEENVWWHNGWLIQNTTGEMDNRSEGRATYYNHNMYFSHATNMTIHGNIFIDPSNTGIKLTSTYAAGTNNVAIDGNLFIGGEIGLNIGNNYNVLHRFKNITVTNNIFTRIGMSNPTGRGVSWGMWLNGWDGGEVSNNIIFDQREDIGNVYGIYQRDDARNVNITNNIIYGLDHGIGIYLEGSDTEANMSGVQLVNNDIQMPSASQYVAKTEFAVLGRAVFSGNRHYGMSSTDFNYKGAGVTYPTWQGETGDTSVVSQVTSYPDPSRSIEAYQESIGASSSTIDAFISTCVTQDRYAWNSKYSAGKVNAWIKAGFTAGLSTPLSSPADFQLVD